MASLLRSSFRVSRPRYSSLSWYASQPRRFAAGYGGSQSGQEQGINEKNPKQHLEHPGPEPPSTQAQGGSSQKESANSAESRRDSQPTIQTPESSSESSDAEVRKHNEEMAQRSERTPNQLSEDDNKVDKKFWKGDVGVHEQEK